MGKSQSKYKSLDKHVIDAVAQGDSVFLRAHLLKLPHYKDKPLDNQLRTALIYAAITNNYEVAKLLVTEFGCDVNIQDKQGWTALMHCVFSNKGNGLSIVHLLCDAGANILAKTQSNTTAIEAAFGCEVLISTLNHYATHGPFAVMSWHSKKKLLWVYSQSEVWRKVPLHIMRAATEFM
mmetsp:Transcript_7303/g.13499  ORF Transcript_7303/g.13499 Transcript_7303/m.13499 type:complete len:179 (+) Transcript_7303:544-1080(+)